MKKIRLITASFGDDKKPLQIKSSLKYKDYIIDVMCYDNNNTASRINSLHPRTKGKLPKMMEWFDFPDYDYYIWIDSKFSILDGFLESLFQFECEEDTDLFIFNHPDRCSIQDELKFMKDMMNDGSPYLLKRYTGENIDKQVNRYIQEPTYHDNHLFYGGLFMYTKRLVQNPNYNLMTDWLLHCTLYSIQDQLSLPYLIHKHNVHFKVYPTSLRDCRFFQYF
jgi:hypothetical protein